MTTIPELTNEVIKEVLAEYEQDYWIEDETEVLLELRSQQDRPWLLVERNMMGGWSRQIYLSMHRSLDSVEWAIAEAMWETSWRPVAVYNTKSGSKHEVAVTIDIEGME